MMDERLKTLLDRLVQDARDALGENLMGFYVHGSIAYGCFRWDTSDVDFLIVTKRAPTLEEKVRLLGGMVALWRDTPPKGLEMSVVCEECCRNFVHPCPYELHLSGAYIDECRADTAAFARRMNGVDPDLAAHFAVTRAVGLTLLGPDVRTLFSPVPREALMDSVLADVMEGDISDNPVYSILNLCRTLALLREGLMLSKRGGGEWMLDKVQPEDRLTLAAILSAYTQGTPPPERPQTLGRWLRDRVREECKKAFPDD